MIAANILRCSDVNQVIKIPPRVELNLALAGPSPYECYMGSDAPGKTPPRDSAGYFEHGDYCHGRAHCRHTADLSAAISRHQLDFLRLGGAALFHADHHLRVRALFRHACGLRSRERTGAVG